MRKILFFIPLFFAAAACSPSEKDVTAFIRDRYEKKDSLLILGIRDGIGNEFKLDTVFRNEDKWIYKATEKGLKFSKSLSVKKKKGELLILDVEPVYGCNLAFREGTIESGESFVPLLQRFGLTPAEAQRVLNRSTDVFDVRRMQAGKTVKAIYDCDISSDVPEYFIYCDNRIKSTVFECSDSPKAWVFEKPTTIEHKIADVTIRTSLWNDMIEAGTSPLLIVELADIYAWTINFFGLQNGDRFRAIYDQRVCEGETINIEQIHFCIYDSGKYSATAVRFDQQDGKDKYWNEKGESMKKAFLKAPLKYNRISSRFSYHRKHPVTGKVRPHTGVDYAAPKGTPVHSIGDGTVTLCGWDGSGGGNRIKIKHMNGYETCYMHLSKFAKGMRAGARVAQGQVIGYVGSTGRSTGPHLDFRVWKDRKPIDPLKMISPPAKPLNAANMDSLKVLVSKYTEELRQAE